MAIMKPCFHSSLTQSQDLAQVLEIAHHAGFALVELGHEILWGYADRHGIAAVRQLFETFQMELASFPLPVDVTKDELTFQTGLSALPKTADLALALGATRSCTWLAPTVDELPVVYASRLARRFRACAKILDSYGMRLGLEFVGPHHLRQKPFPFVWTMGDTLEYIDAIGQSNIGLLFDSYHWYTSGGTVEDILTLSPNRIVHVHVNDTHRLPSEAIDGERLLPGEGVIDLKVFFNSLRQVGYVGPVSIEVLHREPFKDSDENVARRAYQSVSQSLNQLVNHLSH